MAKKTVILQYKYPERPWVEYDRSQVSSWIATQHDRMIVEYPGAEYRKVVK